jgi:RNA ligase (TIGR02306 family)
MSSLQVSVALIDQVLPHPNADRLEIAHVLGWQCVVPKGKHKEGEKVVYFPPDTVLPEDVSDRFGVTKYLSKGRIRCAKLRGEPSFGLVVEPDADWQVGANVADAYGATKYEPPVQVTAGDAAPDHPLFVRYTDIENMRNFPDILVPGEPVVVTEKIHGTQCRVGMIEGVKMAGSKGLRRKEPESYVSSTYWYPWTLSGVQGMLAWLNSQHRQVILFGEVFGKKMQSLAYGQQGLAFRAFDLLANGQYMDYLDFRTLCEEYGVPMVPVLHEGSFSLQSVRHASGGKTTLMDDNAHIREGVVVKPFKERTHPAIGRVILKYVSDEYLFGAVADDEVNEL